MLRQETRPGYIRLLRLFVFIVFLATGLSFLNKEYKPSSPQEATRAAIEGLSITYLNDQVLGSSISGSEIEVGGLSGLAWSEEDQVLYAVSDDRGRQGPSRFYKLTIVEGEGKAYVELQQEVMLTNEKGDPFPKRSFDTEGIAVGEGGTLFISSEGDFKETPTAVPSLIKLDNTGRVTSIFEVGPPVFPKDRVWVEETYGIRYNLSLESLDYHLETKRLVTATENALVQDGKLAGATRGANTRFYLYDLKSGFPGEPVSQKVYAISQIPDPTADEKDSIIGVTDLVQLGRERYLVLERSYLGGRKKNRVQLFLANCLGATDVKDQDQLRPGSFQPCKKSLLFDFEKWLGKLSDFHPRVDNLEGMTLGPRLAGGARLLVFVSDNNFSSKQATQFLFFSLKASSVGE